EALKETRKLLKPSMKSGNKKYEPTLALKAKAIAEGKLEEKERQWHRRNWRQEWVDERLNLGFGSVVNVSGLTLLEAGTRLYNRAVLDAKTWYGNCGEQALIALYLCAMAGVAPKNLFLRTYHKGYFSHSFVLLDAGRSRTLAPGRKYRAKPPIWVRDDPQAVC